MSICYVKPNHNWFINNNNMNKISKQFSINDIAEALRCSNSKIYQMRDEGIIRMFPNKAGKWVCTEDEFYKLLAE